MRSLAPALPLTDANQPPMDVLIALAGFVALLLWGLRMVSLAVERAIGGDLKRTLGGATENRFSAALAGMGVTVLLQSSTATVLMASNFVGRGLITTAAALAVILGADVGTAILAQVLLLFGTGPVGPGLILVGLVLTLRARGARLRQAGRALIGVGLILLALMQISATAEPLATSAVWQTLLDTAEDQVALLVLAGALLTWVAHSSLAVVLLTASFAAGGALGLPMALALVLGANLGATLPALSATAGSSPATRRAPLGNLIFRGTGVAIGIALLPWLLGLASGLPLSPERTIVTAHMAFNVAVLIAFIGLVGPIGKLCLHLLPDQPVPEDPGAPRHLDDSAIEDPARAVPLATREVLRLGDMAETMMRDARLVLAENDMDRIAGIEETERQVDRLAEAIKLYASRARAFVQDDSDRENLDRILAFNTNLEHAADIIATSIMESARKKLVNKLAFSEEGWRELSELQEHVLQNLRLSLSVFVGADSRAARRLIRAKDRIRLLEARASQRHLDRLTEQRTESIETSELHLDLLRDLKRINAHFASIGRQILESTGELAPSRLTPEAPAPSDGHASEDADETEDAHAHARGTRGKS